MANPKSTKRSPTKAELANMKVLHDLGHSPNAIGTMMNRDGKTVRKWLQSEVYQDPDLANLCEVIRAKEREDLELIGAKCRTKLHELIPTATQIIPVVAAMDRTFQQVRLLAGKSTTNVSLIQQYYREADMMKPKAVVDLRKHLVGLPSQHQLEDEG